jgi:hypothetical protein
VLESIVLISLKEEEAGKRRERRALISVKGDIN